MTKTIILNILISINFLFIFFIYHVTLTYAAIPGCFCDGSSSCYSDGCTRKTIKADGSIDYGLCGSAGCGGAYNCCYDTNSMDVGKYFCLTQPPCCAEMVARNDPEACCWPERGYCHPYYCDKVSRPEKCGWYWHWHGNAPDMMARGYGCIIGNTEAEMRPLFGIPAGVPGGGGTQPTTPPQPTKIPTVKPTQYVPPTVVPTSIPTQYVPPPTTYIPPTIQPTHFNIVAPTQYVPPVNNPVIYPTTPPSNNQSYSLPSLSLPVFNTEPLKRSAKNTIIQSEKILNIPSEAMDKITQIDSSLEAMINRWIEDLIDKIKGN